MMLDRAFYDGREKCNDDILRDCENANRRPSSMDDEKCDNDVLKEDESADGRPSFMDDVMIYQNETELRGRIINQM